MQYMLLIHADETAWQSLSPAEAEAAYGAYMEYSKELVVAGVFRAGAELQPVSTAATVQVRGGRTKTTDGPFVETKEQLGGFYLIEVADRGEAMKWASRSPGAVHGTVEIRPLGITSGPDGGVTGQPQ